MNKPIKSSAITMKVKYDVVYEGDYGVATSLLNVDVTSEPVPDGTDPVAHLAARLTEEIKRQAPLLRARLPQVVSTVETVEVE